MSKINLSSLDKDNIKIPYPEGERVRTIKGKTTNQYISLIPQKVNDNTYLLDGSVQIREANKILVWDLPESSAKTINGYILECLEDIPKKGMGFETNNYLFEIVKVQNNFVKNVKITKK